jgi:hypothetical protein
MDVVKVKGKLSLCPPLRHIGEWRYSILNLALIEVRVIFTPRPLYPWGKIAYYSLCKMLGGPQSRPCHFGKDINLLSLLGNGTYSLHQLHTNVQLFSPMLHLLTAYIPSETDIVNGLYLTWEL